MPEALRDETPPLPEPWNVILHRQEQLERAGYPIITAMRLAEHLDVDLHVACDLLKHGATVKQALSILL